MRTLDRTVGSVLSVLLLIVMVQSIVPNRYVSQPKPPVTEKSCVGTPIKVSYAFEGNYLEPWACQEQCNDDKPRYILYSNGKATQCETPPGCNDAGEDSGVTCIVPDAGNPKS